MTVMVLLLLRDAEEAARAPREINQPGPKDDVTKASLAVRATPEAR